MLKQTFKTTFMSVTDMEVRWETGEERQEKGDEGQRQDMGDRGQGTGDRRLKMVEFIIAFFLFDNTINAEHN